MTYKSLDFNINSDFIDRTFEGYKLELIDDKDYVKSYSLDTPVSPKRVQSTTSHLNYDELAFRIHYNHLFPGPSEDSFMFIDQEGSLILAQINKQEEEVGNKQSIFSIPQGSPNQRLTEGYPGAYTLNDNAILVYDGISTAYIIQRKLNHWKCSLTLRFDDGPNMAGANLDSAALSTSSKCYYIIGCELDTEKSCSTNSETLRIMLCFKNTANESKTSSKSRYSNERGYEFCVCAMEARIPNLAQENTEAPVVLDLKPVHTLRTKAIPVYFEYIPWTKQYILGVRDGVKAEDSEMGSSSKSTPSRTMVPGSALKEPYYWTQSGNEVTICMQLDSVADVRDVSCAFTRKSIYIVLEGSSNNTVFRRDNCLYGFIVPDECVWTLENGRLLTLYLQKADDEHRWPHVFKLDDNVLETMDPSELAHIRDQLEKFTSDEVVSNTTPGSVPIYQQSAGFDVDADDDEDEGNRAIEDVIFSVRAWDTGEALSSSLGGESSCSSWLCKSFPRVYGVGNDKDGGPEWSSNNRVCLKFDVDGAVFGFCSSRRNEARMQLPEPKNLGILSAMAFIYSGKRECKYMYFNNSSGDDGKSVGFYVIVEPYRIYIYHAAEAAEGVPCGGAKSKQNIVDIRQVSGVDQTILGVLCFFDKLILVLGEYSLFLVKIPA